MTKRKWKKGYKVVLRQEGLWISSSVNISDDSCCVYSIKEITNRPPFGGPLCVFNNFKDAKDFLEDYFFDEPGAIFECKYLESIDTRLWYTERDDRSVRCFMKGKVLADKVRLIKRVNIRKMKKLLKIRKVS